jgi:hypothetical protein
MNDYLPVRMPHVKIRGMMQRQILPGTRACFNQFPTYNMKILSCDFNAKVGRENIFKPTIGNESLHEISNDNLKT